MKIKRIFNKHNSAIKLGNLLVEEESSFFDHAFEVNNESYRLKFDNCGYGGFDFYVIDDREDKVFHVNCHIYDSDNNESVFILHKFTRMSSKPKGIGTFMMKYLIDIADDYNFDIFEIFVSASTGESYLNQDQLKHFYAKQDYKKMKLRFK